MRLISRNPTSLLNMLVCGSLLCAAMPAAAIAGMPSVLPDDIATVLRLREEPAERVQVISFFLLGLLLAALAIKWLWNGLRREFSQLPRISYGKSLLLTITWGLLFCIVLVMISGARELMTPGAWKKAGGTYQLNEEPRTGPEGPRS